MLPRMSDREADAFCEFAGQATSYFEFGVGGSTFRAAELVKGRVVAVDSDLAWVEKTRLALPPSSYERTLIHVDIGPTKEWGYPADMSEPEKFKAYYSSIENYDPHSLDMCLVDGRFRVACFLNSLKHASADTIICAHDYRSRGNYHVVERFARIIYEVEDISFFVKRRDADMFDIDQALSRHAADAG